MSSKTAWILAIAGIIIASVIGWFIYKSSKTVAEASDTAAASGGQALGKSIVTETRQQLAQIFGI